MVAALRIGHLLDGVESLGQAVGQKFGRGKQGGNRLEIGVVGKVRVWQGDAFGSEIGGVPAVKGSRNLVSRF